VHARDVMYRLVSSTLLRSAGGKMAELIEAHHLRYKLFTYPFSKKLWQEFMIFTSFICFSGYTVARTNYKLIITQYTDAFLYMTSIDTNSCYIFRV